jgi:hypothetical protein
MSYGLGQGLFQFPSDATGVTVSGYQVGTPTPAQLASAQSQAYALSLENFNNSVPVGTTPDTSNPFSLSDLSASLFPASTPSGTPSAMPINWVTLGVIGFALLMLGLVLGKK